MSVECEIRCSRTKILFRIHVEITHKLPLREVCQLRQEVSYAKSAEKQPINVHTVLIRHRMVLKQRTEANMSMLRGNNIELEQIVRLRP